MAKKFNLESFSGRFISEWPVSEDNELQKKLEVLEKDTQRLQVDIHDFYMATGQRSIVPINLGYRLFGGKAQLLKANFTPTPDLQGFDIRYFSRSIKKTRWEGTFSYRPPIAYEQGEVIMRTEQGIKFSGSLDGSDLAFNDRIARMNFGRVTLALADLKSAAMDGELNHSLAQQVRDYYGQASEQALPPES